MAKLWLATAKCIGVFPLESLQLGLALYFSNSLVLSMLSVRVEKCIGVALSCSLQI